jgi:cell division protein FtsW
LASLFFISASLGLLDGNGASFSSVAFSQLVFGIVGGSCAMFITSQIHYRHWRKYAFYIFVACLLLTLLVFVPNIGFTHGGASRWIQLGGFTLQPAEILKIGFIIYMATFLSGVKKNIHSYTHGVLPFMAITGVVGVILLKQPDTDTFILMGIAAVAMFFTAGARIRDLAFVALTAVILVLILALFRPYVMDRFTTFFDPTADEQGSGYQIKQALIAVGSGGLAGRGFGQSVQKFNFLPEPIGDSIFAVYSEEFGFIGSTFLIGLFAAFTFRGYRIASHAPDLFGMLLVVGFMTLIVVQAFLNIAAMISVAPLMGLPLPFISHGGTALLTTLAATGIVLNVSRYQKRNL